MNIVEAFIQNYLSVTNITLMLFGFIIIISEAPFVYTDSFVMIHRAGRKQWYRAMWLYILTQGILYYGCSLIVSVVLNIPKAYIADIWSRPLRKSSGDVLFSYRITIPDERLLIDYTPYSAMLHTFLMILLYSVFLAGILYALNMYRGAAVGTFVTAMVHLMGRVANSLAFMMGSAVSWFHYNNSSLLWILEFQIPLLHSYIWFILSIYIVYCMGDCIVRYTDFYVAEGSGISE